MQATTQVLRMVIVLPITTSIGAITGIRLGAMVGIPLGVVVGTAGTHGIIHPL